MFDGLFKAIFGTQNSRLLKKYQKQVAIINALEAKFQPLSDAELQAAFSEIVCLIRAGETTKEAKLNEVLPLRVRRQNA